MQNPINFNKLRDLDDNNYLVWMGLLMTDESINEMNEFSMR